MGQVPESIMLFFFQRHMKRWSIQHLDSVCVRYQPSRALEFSVGFSDVCPQKLGWAFFVVHFHTA